ncbi:hypothetical protein [Pandoraea soli]
MTRISAGSDVIAQNVQTFVQLVAMRRRDSHGNLHSLDQVANRPVAAVLPRRQPSAPPLDHGDFRADFVSSGPAGHARLPDPAREGREGRSDAATQTDAGWEGPPPYSVRDVTPGAPGPSDAPWRANAL